MEPAIIVKNVSKKFNRKPTAHAHYGIRDLFSEIFGLNKNDRLRKDEFFAVKNISFSLFPGDSIGLIGQNGSGKTTTLTMLAGLLKPDNGKIVTNGRVQALISLGAGFNPNLSGRDNIRNCAAILGLSNNETHNIIDEVIDFSELEEVVDSPVNTYSSGMKARLGFSVAINLKPDIILIDEILSVGDHSFKNKCLTKMQQLKKKGVTMILVSHNETHITQFCEQVIWLDNSCVKAIGDSKEVFRSYIEFIEKKDIERQKRKERKTENKPKVKQRKDLIGNTIYGPLYDTGKVKNVNLKILVGGEETDIIKVNEKVEIYYGFDLTEETENLMVNVKTYRDDGLLINQISSMNIDIFPSACRGRVECKIKIDDFNLSPGSYKIVIPIHEGRSWLWRNIVKEIKIISNGSLCWAITTFDVEYKLLSPLN